MARRKVEGPRVTEVPLEGATELVLLSRSDDLELARDAFVWLLPSEQDDHDTIEMWRQSVEKVAKAVRVVPARRADVVPDASKRSDALERPLQEEIAEVVQATSFSNKKLLLDYCMRKYGGVR